MSGKRKHATQEVGARDAGDREKMAGGGGDGRQEEIRRDEVIRRGKEGEGAKKWQWEEGMGGVSHPVCFSLGLFSI